MQGTTTVSWPRLREDLTLHAGPPERNGAPTWTLHDPARNQYFALDWTAFEVIQRLSLGSVEAVCERISAETTLHLGADEVAAVLQFLDRNELLQRTDLKAAALLAAKHAATESGWLQKILHSYLFFRIPLFRPDAWLTRLLPHLDGLFSGYFLKLSALVGLLGLWGVFRQWEAFSTTLVDTLTIDGLLGYGGALIFIKALHELGHALVAKRCGCRVPTIGVAFLVMWPMAYTDVTESWKLDSHRKRLMIAAAGMLVELIAACWMLLLWVLLPPGQLREVAFFLATTSLIATLAVNASPLMRFDGYFLLCDLLGQPNLHARSFAYARWWLRERLFRLGDPAPEHLTAGWRRFLIVFALMTWAYRLVVFAGIALLVYHYFFKALGVVLFGVEVWYFILRPVWAELMVWQERWRDISAGLRRRPAFYLFLGAFGLLVLPVDVTVNAAGLLRPERSFNVVTHQPAQLQQLPPAVGSRIAAGSPLAELNSPELLEKISRAQIKISALERQLLSAGFTEDTLRQQSVLKGQLDSVRAEMQGLLAEKERLHPVAPFAGVIAETEQDLSVGEWVPKGMTLVRLIDERRWIVDAYVDESELRRIEEGNLGWFVPESGGLPTVGLRVISIDHDAVQTLAEAMLATTAGGRILVRAQGNKLYPDRSIYRVRLQALSLDKKMSTGYLRGSVTILGQPKSVLGGLVPMISATFLRESGF